MTHAHAASIRIVLGLALAFGLLTAARCGDTPWSEPDPHGGGFGFGAPFDPVPSLAEGNGVYPADYDTLAWVQDDLSWAFLYHMATGTLDAPPAVDFGTKIVAAVLCSPRPTTGYALRFGSPSGSSLQYYVRSPDPGEVVAMVVTRPYGFIILDGPGPVERWEGDAIMAGTQLTYEGMVRTDYPLHASFPAANPAHVASLEGGLCPLDGAALEVADLNATPIPNQADSAHYCPVHGAYWARHVSTLTPGPATWDGPHLPSTY